MGKTIAITGINSDLASTILPRLASDPGVDKIIGIDVTQWKGGYSRVTFYREDIRSRKFKDILKGVDVVYHFAVISGNRMDNQKIGDANINGAKNIFASCVHNSVQKVIFASSLMAYASHADTPLGVTEAYPMKPDSDNAGNRSKVQLENAVADFFMDHPEIVLTILRVGLLFGPKTDSMFSAHRTVKIGLLPTGSQTYLQMIHEKDLGDAMWLAFKKDLPGVYNVAADDAVPSRWCFRQAGVFVIPLPMFLLKFIAALSFLLKRFPACDRRLIISRHNLFARCDKFKNAAGWAPQYTSVETFNQCLEAGVRDQKDNLVQSVLSWVFSSGARIRPTRSVLHIFRLGKIKKIREMHPWMNPRKNSMSYLPISYKPEKETLNIKVNENAGTAVSEILPPRIIHDFIDKAEYHVIMDRCGCRLSGECQEFTSDIGCLFMGETALMLPHNVSRRVSAAQAHRHVDRAVGVGLVPIVGKIRVDNFIFLTPDVGKLLSVCFCCHCCCMMGSFKHVPPEHLNHVMTPLEGVRVDVTDACIGCGICAETCIFDAISIENKKAVHSAQCRACGRCVTYCPEKAVVISMDDPENALMKAERRIETYVKVA